ncbi:MAG: hypothetical protein U0W24_09440 [Bacteroidales bacterium]
MYQSIYNRNIRLFVFFLLSFLLACQVLRSQTDTLTEIIHTDKEKSEYYKQERLSLCLGYFITGNNAEITFGSKQAGLGVLIDFEDALGLEASNFVFRGNAIFSYGKRRQHALVVDYFNINRKATKTLEAELEFGDNIYPIGETIKSKLYMSIIRAKYEYTFVQDERVSIGFSAGLFIMPLSFSLETSNIDDQSATMVAPLPLLGLRSDFMITKKLVMKQSAELLYLQVDNFKGGIIDLNFAVEHRTFKHFGIGLGINANRLNISATGEDYPGVDFFGSVKMDYTGAFFYLSYYLW